MGVKGIAPKYQPYESRPETILTPVTISDSESEKRLLFIVKLCITSESQHYLHGDY